MTVRRFMMSAVAAAALSVCTLSAHADEFRGLWADAWHDGFYTPAQVSTLVQRCKDYNFNAVVVQMRRRADGFYFPQAPNLDVRVTDIASDFDALAELINQCHSANPPIQVHCWVVTHPCTFQDQPPSQPDHIFYTHPEYLMENDAGEKFLSEGYYLDPGHPGTTQYNHDMAVDIVSRYNVDGFHWDYIRYPQQNSGYNPTALARYNEEFDLTDKPAPSDAQFSDWRRRQVTDFLRWTNADILAVNPNVIVSTAVFAGRNDAFTNRFQNWAAWTAEGIIDVLIPMNYVVGNALFNSRTDDIFNNLGVRTAYMGQGSYLNTPQDTLDQLLYSRSKGFPGYNLYSYAVPSDGTMDQDGTLAFLRDNLQPDYQAAPAIPWKANPTKGIIRGTITSDAGGLYNADVTLGSAPTRLQLTEPHGKFAFWEVDPGTYHVSASHALHGNASGQVDVAAGSVATMNLQLPAADTTPAGIQSLVVSRVTDRTALVSWKTNEPTDGVVQLGPTTAYRKKVRDRKRLVRTHQIAVSRLRPNTDYYLRIQSKDAARNISYSEGVTFRTVAAGQAADIIIDNTASVRTGTWLSATTAEDKFGEDYLFKSGGDGSASVTFTPEIAKAGTYLVYEWHTAGSNRTSRVPHVVNYAGNSQTVNMSQQASGGQWNLIGAYPFVPGAVSSVSINDQTSETGVVIIADAVKLVFQP